MNTATSEVMKLKKFYAMQAAYVKQWMTAGWDVPNEYEGNLIHYAMCEVIDTIERHELPQRFVDFETGSRPRLVVKRMDDDNLEHKMATVGYATSDERDAHDESAEYFVTVKCHCCDRLNYITV